MNTPVPDPELYGLLYRRAIPECHEHCAGCAGTGCPHPDHNPDWTEGYVARIEDPQGDYDVWLCPECYAKIQQTETIAPNPEL